MDRPVRREVGGCGCRGYGRRARPFRRGLTIDLVEVGLLVTCQFHHPRQILVLVVAAEEFEFSVAADEYQRWAIGTYPVEWGVLVDGGLERWDALHLTHVVVGDGLSAERRIEPHGVGIGIVGLKPSLVQTEHHRDVSSGGMACHHNLLRVATVVGDMAEHPCDGLGCIVEQLADGDLGQLAVVDAHDDEAFLLQFIGNLLGALFESTAMKPNHNGGFLGCLGVIDFELEPLLGVGIGLGGETDVVGLLVVLCPCAHRQQKREGDQAKSFFSHSR